MYVPLSVGNLLWVVLQDGYYFIQNIPVGNQSSWIKGHQDREIPLEDLPLTAQLNCEADTAEAADAHQLTPNTGKFQAPNNPIQLFHHGIPITSKLKRSSRRLLKSKMITDHIKEKTGWSEETFASVDWIVSP
jgi:hypothetical protein